MTDLYDGFEDGDTTEWTLRALSNKITATTNQAASGSHSGLLSDSESIRDLPDNFTGTVTLTVEWRVDQTTDYTYIYFESSSGTNGPLVRLENGEWKYDDGTIKSLGGSPSANTWMTVKFVLDIGADTFDLIVDGTTLGTGLAFQNAVGDIGKISAREAYNNSFWVDDLQTSAPASPSGLAVDATTDTTADLSWTDNATSESGFYVYRATASGSTTSDYTQVADITTADTTTYTDTGLLNGEQYFYRVSAYNADGESSLSNEDSAITVLPAPTNLTADAINGDQVDLSWTDHSDNEDGFRVYRNRDIYYGSHFDSGMGNFTGGFVTDTTQSHDGGQSAYSPGGEQLNGPDFTVPSGVIENVAWHRIGAVGTGQTHLQTWRGSNWAGPHVAAKDTGNIEWHDGLWNSTGQAYPVDQWFYTRTATDVAAGTFDLYYFDPSSMKREKQIITGGAFQGSNTFAADDVRFFRATSNMGTKTWIDTITGVLQSGYTQDGTDLAAVTTAEPNTVTYTTSNLLDGEKYAFKASAFTEHTETEDI